MSYKKHDIIVATYGYNEVKKKPFQFLYEFGYESKYGYVVFNKGESNMQDAHVFKAENIRLATPEDIKNLFWGS